jgi:hypothetical protein
LVLSFSANCFAQSQKIQIISVNRNEKVITEYSYYDFES